MPRVFHVSSVLEDVPVSLLEQLAALDVRLSLRVVEVTTPDHEDLTRGTRLHDLEVVRKHIVSALPILRVEVVRRDVLQLEGLTRPRQQIVHEDLEAVVVKHEYFIADRGSLEMVCGNVGGGNCAALAATLLVLSERIQQVLFGLLRRGWYFVAVVRMLEDVVVVVANFTPWAEEIEFPEQFFKAAVHRLWGCGGPTVLLLAVPLEQGADAGLAIQGVAGATLLGVRRDDIVAEAAHEEVQRWLHRRNRENTIFLGGEHFNIFINNRHLTDRSF